MRALLTMAASALMVSKRRNGHPSNHEGGMGTRAIARSLSRLCFRRACSTQALAREIRLNVRLAIVVPEFLAGLDIATREDP